jgi:hypothetical protein
MPLPLVALVLRPSSAPRLIQRQSKKRRGMLRVKKLSVKALTIDLIPSRSTARPANMLG